MSERPPTLRKIFKDLDAKLADLATAEGQDFDRRFRKELAGVKLVAPLHKVVAKVAELLDIELPDLLMRFWASAAEIKQALEESKEKPQEPIYVGLAEHTATGTFYPTIEVRIGTGPAVQTYPVKFTLELECVLSSVQLQIKNGAIRAIDYAVCTVKGTFKLRELVIATAPRDGQGKIRLGPGEKL